jgi:3-hydroxybutyryl-CoA dehydratase
MINTPESPRNCKTINEMNVGDQFIREYTITYDDVKKFSEICGDWNPIHHDPEFAKGTIFKKQIAHGMISVAKFSGTLGMDLPGLGTIYLSQNVNFTAPAYLDTPYKAVMEVSMITPENNTVTFCTWCEDEHGKKILSGKATAKPIPEKVRNKMQAVA